MRHSEHMVVEAARKWNKLWKQRDCGVLADARKDLNMAVDNLEDQYAWAEGMQKRVRARQEREAKRRKKK